MIYNNKVLNEREEAAERNETMTHKLLVAYGTAMRASHQGGRISIRISRDVADWAKDNWLAKVDEGAWVPPMVRTCWGFPLHVEEAWEPGRVVVTTDTEIM